MPIDRYRRTKTLTETDRTWLDRVVNGLKGRIERGDPRWNSVTEGGNRARSFGRDLLQSGRPYAEVKDILERNFNSYLRTRDAVSQRDSLRNKYKAYVQKAKAEGYSSWMSFSQWENARCRHR